ncbi:MAG: LVIVD repeat-containing protein [Candidatus Zixiibacteriota bacterium]
MRTSQHTKTGIIIISIIFLSSISFASDSLNISLAGRIFDGYPTAIAFDSSSMGFYAAMGSRINRYGIYSYGIDEIDNCYLQAVNIQRITMDFDRLMYIATEDFGLKVCHPLHDGSLTYLANLDSIFNIPAQPIDWIKADSGLAVIRYRDFGLGIFQHELGAFAEIDDYEYFWHHDLSIRDCALAETNLYAIIASRYVSHFAISEDSLVYLDDFACEDSIIQILHFSNSDDDYIAILTAASDSSSELLIRRCDAPEYDIIGRMALDIMPMDMKLHDRMIAIQTDRYSFVFVSVAIPEDIVFLFEYEYPYDYSTFYDFKSPYLITSGINNGIFVYQLHFTDSFPDRPDTMAIIENYRPVTDFRHIETYRDRAYVSSYSQGISTIDFTTGDLELVDTLSTFGDCYGMEIADTLLFIGDGLGGLGIYSLAEPDMPEELASLPTPDFAYDIAIDSHFAYIAADDSGLFVIDFTDLEDMERIANIVLPRTREIAIKDSFAFITSQFHGLFSVYIADPFSPEILDSISFGNIWDVEIYGDYAFVSGYDHGISIIDIEYPASLVNIGMFLDSISIIDIAIGGKYAICSARMGERQSRIYIIDIQEPETPVIVGFYEMPTGPYSNIWGVELAGDIAFAITDAAGLFAFDISEAIDYYESPIYRGWNLLSWQFDYSPLFENIYPERFTHVYKYFTEGRHYIPALRPEPGKGESYWVLYPHDTLIYNPMTYDGIDATHNVLVPGWNMIAPPGFTYPVDSLESLESVIAPIYRYNNETGIYAEADTMYPGTGYWILCRDTLTINIE